jgi:VWFA-related protein
MRKPVDISRRSIPALLSLLLAVTAAGAAPRAQDEEVPPAPAAASEPLPSELEEKVEVNLLTLDFMVTDKKGQPVLDLRPDEVRVFDAGKEMPLAFLERVEDPPPWVAEPLVPASLEMSFGAAPRDLPVPPGRKPRWILFVLDRYNITPDTRAKAISAARTFLEQSWKPGDRAGLAVYDTAMRFVLDGLFTTDPSLVSLAISDPDRYAPDPNFDRTRALEDLLRDMDLCKQFGDPRPCAVRKARNYVTFRENEARDYLANLSLVARVLGTVPGRKYMVLFSNGFSVQPGNEAADAFISLFGDDAVRSIRLDLMREVGSEVDDLIEQLARNKITLFAIDTRRQPAGSLSPAQRDLATEDVTAPVDPFQSEFWDSRATLASIADASGGRHYVGFDASQELYEAMRAAEGLYTAGYYSKDLQEAGWRRKVKVKVSRPGVEVTHRHNYKVAPRLPPPIRAGLFPGEPRWINPERVEVPITVIIDPESVPFAVGGGVAVSQLTVHVALRELSGRPAAESFHFLGLEYPEKPYREKKIRPPRYEGLVAAPPGDYVLELRLADPGGGGTISFQRDLHLEAEPPAGRPESGAAPAEASAPPAEAIEKAPAASAGEGGAPR